MNVVAAGALRSMIVPGVRPNVDGVTATQLTAFPQAMSAAMEPSGDRRFQHHAGIDELSLPISCNHRNFLFLPWHRAYLPTPGEVDTGLLRGGLPVARGGRQ